jgi:hypothetical protein
VLPEPQIAKGAEIGRIDDKRTPERGSGMHAISQKPLDSGNFAQRPVIDRPCDIRPTELAQRGRVIRSANFQIAQIEQPRPLIGRDQHSPPERIAIASRKALKRKEFLVQRH